MTSRKASTLITGFFVLFSLLAILVLIVVVTESNREFQKPGEKAGWTWRMKDHDGNNIWSRCQGQDMIYMDDHDGSIAILANGCSR